MDRWGLNFMDWGIKRFAIAQTRMEIEKLCLNTRSALLLSSQKPTDGVVVVRDDGTCSSVHLEPTRVKDAMLTYQRLGFIISARS